MYLETARDCFQGDHEAKAIALASIGKFHELEGCVHFRFYIHR